MNETHKTLSETVAGRLRELRKAADLSQGPLAKRMRSRGHAWGDTVVSRVERCEREVSVPELVTLAAVLGVRLQALLEPYGSHIEVGGVPIESNIFRPWALGVGTLQLGDDKVVRLDTPLFMASHPELFREKEGE
ncbi:hypothetical protein BH18ACT15_BH18ACT15_11840 [soil metagenome]